MCRSVMAGDASARCRTGLWTTQRTESPVGAFLPGVDEWTLPGYDVEQLLGRGAHGEVWRAREVATGETVALKRVRGGDDPPARDRLRDEAAVLAAFTHDHVVRLRRVVGDGDGSVLVLDHAGGGSLAAILATGRRLEPGEVVTTAAPLAEALAAAHHRGLVHGDVSPANV